MIKVEEGDAEFFQLDVCAGGLVDETIPQADHVAKLGIQRDAWNPQVEVGDLLRKLHERLLSRAKWIEEGCEIDLEKSIQIAVAFAVRRSVFCGVEHFQRNALSTASRRHVAEAHETCASTTEVVGVQSRWIMQCQRRVEEISLPTRKVMWVVDDHVAEAVMRDQPGVLVSCVHACTHASA